MKIENTVCPDIKLIHCFSYGDSRGGFTKIFSNPDYLAAGLDVDIKEIYYSMSNQNVIRGMHFQLPPYDHAKIVHVISGAVTDVVLDLRKTSPTYKRVFSLELKAADHVALYIPKGFAHGFRCLEDNTIMLYQVTSAYEKLCDTGILYNSIPYDWGVAEPIVSDRDMTFERLEDFISPF